MEACADGRLKLGLTESPVFVSSVGGTRLVDQWVQVERRYRELRTGSVQTPYVVRVANLGSELLAGTLTCDPPDGITAAEAKQGFEVPPGETRNFTVAIDVAADCEPGLRDLVFALESHPLYSSRSMISVVRPETALAPARVAEAPVIDGKLDEEAWQDAKAFTPFLDDTTGFVPLVNQEVRLVYDAKGLYVGMTCRTRAGEALRADHQERDDPLLWQDECVELFLDPDLDRNNYYQFIVNVEGVEGDRKYVDTKTQKPDWEGAGDWDGSMTSATSRTEDRWAVEIHIPWEDVEVEPGRVHRMGINLCRKYAPVGDATIRSYTPSGIQVHGVESYPVVEVDLR